jgi:hemolysin activation/secretion protein
MSFRFALLLVFATILHAASAESSVMLINRLVLADTNENALAVAVDPASGKKLYTENLALFATPEFERSIERFIGQPITTKSVNDIANTIKAYARSHDRLITEVTIPNQNVRDGTLRLGVIVGRFKDVAIKGNRYFSSDLLRERLGINPGDEIRLSVLESAVNWANTNPFRRVMVVINPLEGTPGQADLVVGVREMRPWRFSAAVDNYGNDVLGNYHYTAAIQAGNLWGRDHQASYQFVTGEHVSEYQVHAFNYRVPLPWRHFLELSASYSHVDVAFGPFHIAGFGENAELKYTVPFRTGDNPIEGHVALEFKRSNNNLEYGSAADPANFQQYPTFTDVLEANVGLTYIQHDKHGAWVVVANGYLSPGHLERHNTAAVYSVARTGADPSFAYGNLNIQRLQVLPHGFELQSRVTGQITNRNLIGTEQQSIGGPFNVRGFKTNVFTGDEGIIASNDLLTPTLTTNLTRLSAKLQPLQTRFAAFYDFGELWYHQHFIDVGLKPLASAGVGLRSNISDRFSVNFDYGWQITRKPFPTMPNNYGHIKVVLAF